MSQLDRRSPGSDLLAVINGIVLTVLFCAVWIWCGIQIILSLV